MQLRVIQSEDERETVTMDREHILVYVRDKNDRSRIKRLLTEWYRREGERVFSERVEAWYPRFERYGIRKPKVNIRQMRSQ